MFLWFHYVEITCNYLELSYFQGMLPVAEMGKGSGKIGRKGRRGKSRGRGIVLEFLNTGT